MFAFGISMQSHISNPVVIFLIEYDRYIRTFPPATRDAIHDRVASEANQTGTLSPHIGDHHLPLGASSPSRLPVPLHAHPHRFKRLFHNLSGSKSPSPRSAYGDCGWSFDDRVDRHLFLAVSTTTLARTRRISVKCLSEEG